MDRVCYPG